MWRDAVVKDTAPCAEADAISRSSSSEADEACAGDPGPGKTPRGAERYGEGILNATFRRIKKAISLSQRDLMTGRIEALTFNGQSVVMVSGMESCLLAFSPTFLSYRYSIAPI